MLKPKTKNRDLGLFKKRGWVLANFPICSLLCEYKNLICYSLLWSYIAIYCSVIGHIHHTHGLQTCCCDNVHGKGLKDGVGPPWSLITILLFMPRSTNYHLKLRFAVGTPACDLYWHTKRERWTSRLPAGCCDTHPKEGAVLQHHPKPSQRKKTRQETSSHPRLHFTVTNLQFDGTMVLWT